MHGQPVADRSVQSANARQHQARHQRRSDRVTGSPREFEDLRIWESEDLMMDVKRLKKPVRGSEQADGRGARACQTRTRGCGMGAPR